MIEKIKISTDEQTSQLLTRIKDEIADAIDIGLSNYDIEEVKSAVSSNNSQLTLILEKTEGLLSHNTSEKIEAVSKYLQEVIYENIQEMGGQINGVSTTQTEYLTILKGIRDTINEGQKVITNKLPAIEGKMGDCMKRVDLVTASIKPPIDKMQNEMQNLLQKMATMEQTQSKIEERINAPWYKRLGHFKSNEIGGE